jgi:hypothetical protein
MGWTRAGRPRHLARLRVRSLGITLMIGQSDQAGEILTIANAQSLVSFTAAPSLW